MLDIGPAASVLITPVAAKSTGAVWVSLADWMPGAGESAQPGER